MPPRQPQHSASNAEGQPDLNPNDETADPGAYLFAEPDLESFSPIVSGMYLWASHRQNASNAPPAGPGTLPAPLVPWDDLPFPRSDRTKLAPSTIRWQFTGRFNLNCEEAVAQGSICIQVKRWLEHKGFPNPSFTVNFPRGAGRGRFVDVNVDHCQMVALADMPLVFRGARLERHLVGPALPKSAMVVETTGFSEADDFRLLARSLALFLQPYAKVHDVWLEMQCTNADATIRPTNRMVALIETAYTNQNCRDPSAVHAMSGPTRVAIVSYSRPAPPTARPQPQGPRRG
ncbi:hypothetical protein NDA16_002568 [Ustilago loliicola]|nr:hypothetical protein NDA16_002568 [Ustilago loliicola]